MRNLFTALLFSLTVCLGTQLLCAEETVAFRTDENPDDKLPWYQIQPGVFPPEGSAHYFSGELIEADHLNRYLVLRADRTDKQNRSHWDLPVGVTMLPYGSIYYHGAPASLEDIPLGTHLHGLFYLKDPNDKSNPLEGWHNRKSIEADFTQGFRLEDDFSFYTRQNQQWRIDEINSEENHILATLMSADKPLGSSLKFDISAATRIWQGRGFATQKDLAKGQLVQLNITWATLYGPGRLTDVWLDEESRKLSAAQQLETHLAYIRLRGIPGWIDKVDNKKRLVTVTFFGGLEPILYTEVVEGEQFALAVAEANLRMYDPVNDRKRGPVISVKQIAKQPGSSGIQVQLNPDLMLEGYRPQRIVRVYPGAWRVIALPSEEQLFGK